MKLVKENIEKAREVYKTDTSYIKHWHGKDFVWLLAHIKRLERVRPDYIINYGPGDGFMWAEFAKLEGTPASEFEHTPEFVKRITEYCVNNYKETYPYAHGDWVLSNIIINGDTIEMCDWDNVDKYPKEGVLEKMRNDLKSAFGDKFDTASI